MKRYTFEWMGGAKTTVDAADEWVAYRKACANRQGRVAASADTMPFREMVVKSIPVDWATVGPELLDALNGMVETHRVNDGEPVLVAGWIQARRMARMTIAKAEDPQ